MQRMANRAAMTTAGVNDALRRIVGSEGLDRLSNGQIVVTPATESECASVLKAATNNEWRVRFTGGISLIEDEGVDIVLATSRMDSFPDVKPDDLFATVEAGVRLDRLHEYLASFGMWLAADPPSDRSVGASVATGISGPIQTGFGPVRDQVLGLTLVTGTGRIVTAGGRVVKNVAGYDIPKLAIGSFGAFGLITKVHLRLRVQPEADTTWTTSGDLATALRVKKEIEESSLQLAALELRSDHHDTWTIAIRVLGSTGMTTRCGEKLARIDTGVSWTTHARHEASAFWTVERTNAVEQPVNIRVGANAASLPWTIEETTNQLGPGFTTVYGRTNSVRWSGETTTDKLDRLRHTMATRAIPVTIEKAPEPIVTSEGHFGALRSGNSELVTALRSVFDSGSVLHVPLTPNPDRLI